MDWSSLSGIAPWVIGGVGALAVTHFLRSLGTWEIEVPWQIRAFTRIFVLLVFVYLLLFGLTALLGPDNGKLDMFSQNIALVGDLIKTLIGALIGALSTTMTSAVQARRNQSPEPDVDSVGMPEEG